MINRYFSRKVGFFLDEESRGYCVFLENDSELLLPVVTCSEQRKNFTAILWIDSVEKRI